MKVYSEIKNKLLKMKYYYVANQGEYMNNYKNTKNINYDEVIDQNDKLESLALNIKNVFFDQMLFKFTNFEMNEIKRINEIIETNNIDNFVDDNQLLGEKDVIKNILSFAFDQDEIVKFNEYRVQKIKENRALNFAMKSMLVQKKQLIENYNISGVLKLSEKLSEAESKINNQRLEIQQINKDLIAIENSFFERYLDLLNDVSNNVLKSKNTRDILKNYDTKIIFYFKINKFIAHINDIKSEYSINEIINFVKNDSYFRDVFGEYFSYLLDELVYVGTDSKSSDK